MSDTLANDILHGAKAIGEFIGVGERKAYYWLEKGYIPGKKTGSSWSSTKPKLRQHFEGEGAV